MPVNAQVLHNLLYCLEREHKVKLLLAYWGFVLVPKYVSDFFCFCFSILVMVKAKDPFVLGMLSHSPTNAKPL